MPLYRRTVIYTPDETIQPDDLMSVNEAARVLGVKPSTITNMADRGTLDAYVFSVDEHHQPRSRRFVRRSQVLARRK